MMNGGKIFESLRLKVSHKFFAVFCLSVFTYQVARLSREYNQGKTVAHIEIGQLYQDGPPGITVCPAGLNMVKMATINDKYKKLHEEYIHKVNDSTDGYFNIKYHYNVHQDIIDGLLNRDDIFNKYTYDYEEEMSMGKIRLQLEMRPDNDDQTDVIITINTRILSTLS